MSPRTVLHSVARNDNGFELSCLGFKTASCQAVRDANWTVSPRTVSRTKEFPSRVPHKLSNAATRRPTCIFVISVSITPYTYPDKIRRSIINHLLCSFCLFCCILYRSSHFTIFIHRIQTSTVWLSTPQCMVLCVWCMLAPHSNGVGNSLLLCAIVIHLGCIVP